MGLTNKMLILDSTDWDELQKLYPRQASAMIREYIRSVVSVAKGDLNTVNIKLVQQDLEQKEALLNKTQNEVTYLREQVEGFKRLKTDQEREKLERKKEQLEHEISLTKCFHCLKNIDTSIEFRGKAYRLCVDCLRLHAPLIPIEYLEGGNE